MNYVVYYQEKSCSNMQFQVVTVGITGVHLEDNSLYHPAGLLCILSVASNRCVRNANLALTCVSQCSWSYVIRYRTNSHVYQWLCLGFLWAYLHLLLYIRHCSRMYCAMTISLMHIFCLIIMHTMFGWYNYSFLVKALSCIIKLLKMSLFLH